jgi:CHASE1-domain containing sensor protein
MTVQDWTAIVVAIATALAGVTAMLRFLVKHYLSELKPNGGSSVKDQVNRLEARVDDIYRLLCERTSK